jgi:dTDP-4-dehydrorhamnose reductase
VLVLGATGMLGHVVIEVLGEDFEVHGTVRDTAWARGLGIDTPRLHEFEASVADTLPPLLERLRPDVVINCIGVVKQIEAAGDPVVSIALNSLFPHAAARACRAGGARFVHLSTDCVFSGDLAAPARYTEDDLEDCRDLYGRSKLLGEVDSEGALTLRTSLIGWELERRIGLLEWFASQANTRVRGYANAIFSGFEAHALARIIGAVIRDHPGLSGLYHVAAEPISKLELLIALNDALALGSDVQPVETPAVNRALDASRFREQTKIPVPSWSSMIDECARTAR